MKKFLREYHLSILTGILIGTSFIPFPPWASLFCFVPLWTQWILIFQNNSSLREQIKKVFFAGWIAQYLLTLIGFNWIAHTIHEFGHFPWPVAILTFLVHCGIANLYIPLAGVTWVVIANKWKLKDHWILILVFVITALFENRVGTIFPWNFGYTWYWANIPIFHTAELFGFQGLSTFILLMNCILLIGYWNWRITKSSPKSYIALGITLFLAANGCGYYLKKRLPNLDSSFNVMLVQANIGNIEKEQDLSHLFFQENIFNKYRKLTRDSLSTLETRPDFIVWPETAYPYQLQEKYRDLGYNQLAQLALEAQSYLVTGGYGSPTGESKISNSIFVMEPNGTLQNDNYYKTYLLAFGEYIPGSDYFPILKNLIPAGDFARGPGPTAKDIPLQSAPGEVLKIGPQICYESLFPDFAVGLAAKGADVIVNVTNDSWYGNSQEPLQHLYMTLARGIEIRRPVIRSTNTGISTVALADGNILKKSPLFEPWAGHYKVDYKKNAPQTFFQKFPWLTNALLIMTFLIIIFGGRKSLG